MTSWQPTANFENLKIRARVLAQIRNFFVERQVLEVETPLLCHASVTDPYIQSFAVYPPGSAAKTLGYLQTSPEYAMKRLLAAGSGAIYQICKAFRYEESGRVHNPEFTMLEWYRPGFTHHDLMDETDALLSEILKTPKAQRISYQHLFEQFVNLNPHTADVATLKQRAMELGVQVTDSQTLKEKDDWLLLLMSHVIEPHLGFTAPVFVYDFPASQAALARLHWKDNTLVAARFEVYVSGLELANGFYELTDANEQRQRFFNNCQQRQQLNLPSMPLDEYLLAALEYGLPDCSGIALGIDRLVMLAAGTNEINTVLSFTFENA